MSTILILLDAFRQDYRNQTNTPFLWRCGEEGELYDGVEQSLGYCERTEVLAGLNGKQSGFFTAIGFDPEGSPYAKLTLMPLYAVLERAGLFMARLFPARFSDRVHKRLRGKLAQRFRRRGIHMPPFLIPFTWLRYFSLTEDRIDHRLSNAFPQASILTLLEQAGRSYFYDSFTALGFTSPHRTDAARLKAVVQDATAEPKDLYLVYIAAPDAWGHRLGPDAPEFQLVLNKLDQDLAEFVSELERVSPGNRYIFLGDHGMVTVTRTIDLEREIARLLRHAKLKKGRDVLYFLDSTMARFWAMSDRASACLAKALESSTLLREAGNWMDREMAEKFHVPWPDRRYGDHLWVAHAGVSVFPDFFHRLEPCKGMHGYDPTLPECRGTCIHWGRGVEPRRFSLTSLSGVNDVLKRSLSL